MLLNTVDWLMEMVNPYQVQAKEGRGVDSTKDAWRDDPYPTDAWYAMMTCNNDWQGR